MGIIYTTLRLAGQFLCRTLECRHRLLPGRVLQGIDKYLLLTKNLWHHFRPLQHHL
jgi:hypothetical protein